MPNTSTAYVLVKSLGWRYSFDGVTSVSHSLSLKIVTDADSSSEGDTVNNARNEPDVVTLSVVASDTHVNVAGWSMQTLRSLAAIKESRYLCKVVTSLRTYDDMLLSSIDVLQDETCPEGWTGTLTFTHASKGSSSASHSEPAQVAQPRSSGASAAKNVGKQSGSVLQTILKEAGIKLGP